MAPGPLPSYQHPITGNQPLLNADLTLMSLDLDEPATHSTNHSNTHTHIRSHTLTSLPHTYARAHTLAVRNIATEIKAT